jgi:putative transposase
MTRAARAVAVGYPHLVGISARPGRELFSRFKHGLAYLLHLHVECRRRAVRVAAWWLGKQRIYLVMLPATKAGMAGALGEAHRWYARRINAEAGARAGLFAPHYESCVVKPERLADAARFVELGGARGRLGADGRPLRPWRYLWSSARYNYRVSRLDPLVTREERRELWARVADWRRFLAEPVTGEELREIRKVLRAGRALGDRKFAARLSRTTRKKLRKGRPGPKPKPEEPNYSWPYRQYDKY